MNNLLKGIMKYRCTVKDQMVRQFEQVRDNPKVSKKQTGRIYTSSSFDMFVQYLHAHSTVKNFVHTRFFIF